MKIFFTLLFIPAIILASIGKVTALKGNAKVHRGSGTYTLKTGSPIQRRDRITTGSKSRVQIVLNDRTRVTIGEKADYRFSDYSFGGKRGSLVKMKAQKGFFRVVTGKIGKIAPNRFKVGTRSAMIGIRGTDFYGFVKKNFEKIVCVMGRISVAAAGKVFDLRPGQMVVLQNGKWSQGIAGTQSSRAKGNDASQSTQEEQSSYFQNETGKTDGAATHHLWF